MRVYESDDVKVLPGDIVREQDFVMRLRHLHRQGKPCRIINVVFSALPALMADVEKREAILRLLTPPILREGGQVHVMSLGDVFVIAPDNSGIPLMLEQALTFQDAKAELIHSYHLPEDYSLVRERGNHYIETARAAAQLGSSEDSPEVALLGEQVRGALTPWALDQIIKLFAKIDLRRYVRSQPIYRHTGDRWQIASTEYFVSVEDLRRERFPRLEIRTPERLFMELCSELDYRLLNTFAEQPGTLASGPINLNIAVESVMGAPFAKFLHTLTPEKRRQMTFEINRGEFLMNYDVTIAAIETLRREGFQIALDALHPAMLPILNCGKLSVDWLKIRASSDVLGQYDQPEVRGAIKQLRPETLIFYRCDNVDAITVGKKVGNCLFQGWAIDDLVLQDKMPT